MEPFVTDILLCIIIALLIASAVMLIILLKRSSRFDFTTITSRLDSFEKAQERAERAVKEEVAQNRSELGNASKEQRLELSAAFKSFGDSVIERIGELTNIQKGQLETMSTAIERLSGSIEKKMEETKVSLDGRLKNIQDDNAKQLEQMRQVVDEKLQGTLEKRLGESFRQVSERLELVHKGLGEMQALATGVGDLKKVLTNVKTRGTWGEVQLGALLEQVLTPEQFATNVATQEGAERVEFAIKLPGQGTEKDDMVYLPIDAKFPVEDYQRLIEAQERADAEAIELAGRQLEARVRSCAYDICSKYINPPKTTDFAILFLPIEGLFAEVIRTGQV